MHKLNIETCVTYEVRLNKKAIDEFRVLENAVEKYNKFRNRNKHALVELVRVISVRKETRMVLDKHHKDSR